MDTNQQMPILELEPEGIMLFFGREREQRRLVSIDQIPVYLIYAVLSAEDSRFCLHRGIDPRGILRALYTNIRRGEIRQGGSTLTQQLVKNYFLTPARTLRRKFKEFLMAVAMELMYDKNTIFEIYLNEIYFGNKLNKRPYIILKTVQSLDGRIATATGDSRWISSPESLKLAHELRAEVDAVVVGMGTVRADNPALTVRRVKGRNPYRVVVSGSLKFPKSCHLLDNNPDFKTVIASSEKAIDRFQEAGARSGTNSVERHPRPAAQRWNRPHTHGDLIFRLRV